MGYHVNKIPKGKHGDFSKIKEEFLEAEDAKQQGIDLMVLVELSDLILAIEAYSLKKYKMSLKQLIKMSKATKRAFKTGRR